MDLIEDSTTANISSLNSFTASNSTPSRSSFKRKRKFKKKDKSRGKKSACLAPDLDIVSGFAFLSFSNVEDLEHHIEETEAKSRSLSINVGQKRKIQPKGEEKAELARSVSKRIRIPSQKILESYATSDIPINKLVADQDLHSKQPGKLKISPDEKLTSSYLHINKGQLSDKEFLTSSCSLTNPNKRSLQDSSNTGISLECSETIDVCMFDDEDVVKSLSLDNNSNIEKSQEKKHKKKKKNAGISDTSCQTMFRIKKKKKKRHNVDDSHHPIKAPPNIMTENVDDDVNVTEICQENNQAELTGIVKSIESIHANEPSDFAVKDESMNCSAKEKYKQLQATKYFDSRHPRQKFSNKVEKIDYCARSGGVNLVEKHHQRQARLKEMDSVSTASYNQQFPPENDFQDSCDASIHSDSGNESSSGSIEQEGLLSNKSRIFAGSSSVFVSSGEPHDESEISIDDDVGDPSDSPINIVKALPKNYLFGHFSTYPDKSTDGTVDVSIQIYDNDIQLYMNYASEFNGKIIKIITPDHEETSKNTNSCLPHSSSFSGVPKFLQPQEYVKAVRSATERNRRHTLGDLFNNLKNEIFGDVREFYFSKQAILSKALEVINTADQDYHQLNKEKAKLSTKNQQLRKSLNELLFGEDADCGKKLDVDKVTEYLKTIDIEIEIPEKSDKDDNGEASQNENSDAAKNVTKKGRPPLEGKLSRKIVLPSRTEPPSCEVHAIQPKQIPNNVNVVMNNKIKGFIAIAPKDTESEVKVTPIEQEKQLDSTHEEIEKVPISEPKHESTTNTPIGKIVCNISRYRLQQSGNITSMTLVTNPAEPLKAIDSKNVVHIKISNDTVKQISSTESPEVSITLEDKDSKTVTRNDNNSKSAEVSQLNTVSLCESKSLSTQTDLDDMPLCTDHNSNSVKPQQQAVVTNAATAAASKLNSEWLSKRQFLLPKPSVAVTTTTTIPVTTTRPLIIKPTDSLKKLVNILKERALIQSSTNTSVAKTQDLNEISTQAIVTGASPIAGVQCSTVSTVTNTRPLVIQVQASKTISPLSTSKAPILQTDVPIHRLLTTNRTGQVQKANFGQVTMATPRPVTMTTPGHVAMTTQGHVTIATSKHVNKTTQGHVTATTHGHVTMETPKHVTITTPVHVTTATPKHVAMTTTGHVTLTAPAHVTTPVTMAIPKHVAMATQGGLLQQVLTPAENLLKQPIASKPPEQRYVKVLPHSSPSPNPVVKGPVNIVPNSSVPSSSPIRIIFKPTGKPINTPNMEQVQGALQSQRLLRLPIAKASLTSLQTTTSLPHGNTVLPNPLQAPNIRFLLQNNKQVVQQAGSIPQKLHSMPLIRGKVPQVVYSKALVRIQPLPPSFQNSTITKQVLLPVPCSLPANSLSTTSIPVGTATMSTPVQPSLSISNTTTKPSTFNVIPTVNVNPTVNSTAQLTNAYNSQTVLRNSSPLTATGVNQLVFNQASGSHSMKVPQQGIQQVPSFQVKQQQTKPPTVMQKPVTTTTTADSKKTIFSGMEEMVAKIPSPLSSTLQQQNVPLQNKFNNNLTNMLNATVQLQRLVQDRVVGAVSDNTTKAINNSSGLQMSTTCSTSARSSLQTTEIKQAKPSCFISEEMRTSYPTNQSNIPATTAQTSVTHSSTCSSVVASFQLAEPKQDKTCSVVESAVDNSNVVTADTLSVWNIDSSIPDITSELQDDQQGTLLADGLFDSMPPENTDSPSIIGDQEKEHFARNNESTTEDFDLLAASLESAEQCF